MNRCLRPALILTLLVAFVTPALAAWPNKTSANLPICTAPNNQSNPTIVSDGAGGAIITWSDRRTGTGTEDIYAQHVLESGVADPAWPANGLAVCTAAAGQLTPEIVSDGAGGAIVTWPDLRNGGIQAYAQHVLASGAVDPAWPLDGRALSTAASNQYSPKIVSDGAGGAIVTWYDYLGTSSGLDIYVQHVLASGAVDPAWPAAGRALCTATDTQDLQRIASDGDGGAIVTWRDLRSGTQDIYAQHVLASGAVDSTWPVDGRAVCTATNIQDSPFIVSDGNGGAIVSWMDGRGGGPYDLYAQHLLFSGTVDPAWPLNGRALCTAANSQIYQAMVSDGIGGAIVTWQDDRSGTSFDIYAQHVLVSGTVDPNWPLDGRALCTAINDQVNPSIVSDDAGGAIVTWSDARYGYPDVYAEHVLASGAVDLTWPLDGRALSTAGFSQAFPKVASDGAGGAIVTWYDFRTGLTTDIYAQRVARFGYIGTPGAEIAGVKDIPNDNGGSVKVSWIASYLDLAQDANLAAYDLYRSVPPNTAASARATGSIRVIREGDMLPLNRSGLVTFPTASHVYSWEFVATVNPNHFASQYGLVTSTAFDSLGAGNPKTAFLVLARNSSGSMFWPSIPDSGYSVDNVAPAAPARFTANYAAGTTYLHWNRNTEADLAGYRLYRSTSLSFTPSPSTLVASVPDTGYADVAGSPYVYKLTAVDVHGNESPIATIMPTGTTGVGDGPAVSELALAPASPNPASRGTTLRFALPAGASVSLGMYDAAGRLVRTLTRGALPAGEHTAAWDLRDGNGRAVGAGLYFARLEIGGRTLVRRVAVTR